MSPQIKISGEEPELLQPVYTHRCTSPTKLPIENLEWDPSDAIANASCLPISLHTKDVFSRKIEQLFVASGGLLQHADVMCQNGGSIWTLAGWSLLAPLTAVLGLRLLHFVAARKCQFHLPLGRHGLKMYP